MSILFSIYVVGGLFLATIALYSVFCAITEMKKEDEPTDSSTIDSTLREISKQLVTLTNDAEELSRKIQNLESLGNV